MQDACRLYAQPAASERAAAFTVTATIRRRLFEMAAGIVRELRIRRDTRRLLEAEPRLLKDLGIARTDVARLVRHGRDGRR
jgi:uncharacterized protein YjiS (DUF1127 family)